MPISESENVFLTLAEEQAQLAALDAAEGTKIIHYSGFSSIVLGIAGSNIVVQKFRIHKEILENVFNSNNMPTTDVITTGTKPTKASTVTLNGRKQSITDKGLDISEKGAKGFIGRLIRIPIPASAGAKLHKYFNSTSPRKNVYIMFPKATTNPAIAMWMAQHANTAYAANLSTFYTERGSKVSFDPTKYAANDLPTISALLGKFSPTYTARLADVKGV